MNEAERNQKIKALKETHPYFKIIVTRNPNYPAIYGPIVTKPPTTFLEAINSIQCLPRLKTEEEQADEIAKIKNIEHEDALLQVHERELEEEDLRKATEQDVENHFLLLRELLAQRDVELGGEESDNLDDEFLTLKSEFDTFADDMLRLSNLGLPVVKYLHNLLETHRSLEFLPRAAAYMVKTLLTTTNEDQYGKAFNLLADAYPAREAFEIYEPVANTRPVNPRRDLLSLGLWLDTLYPDVATNPQIKIANELIDVVEATIKEKYLEGNRTDDLGNFVTDLVNMINTCNFPHFKSRLEGLLAILRGNDPTEEV